MTKKIMAILGAALLTAALGAKEINNFFDGDFPRLIPSVQNLERLEKGAASRTAIIETIQQYLDKLKEAMK